MCVCVCVCVARECWTAGMALGSVGMRITASDMGLKTTSREAEQCLRKRLCFPPPSPRQRPKQDTYSDNKTKGEEVRKPRIHQRHRPRGEGGFGSVSLRAAVMTACSPLNTSPRQQHRGGLEYSDPSIHTMRTYQHAQTHQRSY